MPDRDDFLRRVDAALPFMTEQRKPVIEELRGHLDESVAALADDGWDPVGAEEEALRRIGDPEELARDIGRAQQTRRRLLAAAGAGVLNVGTSLVSAIALLIPPMLMAYVALTFATVVLGYTASEMLRGGGLQAAVGTCVTVAIIGFRLPLAFSRVARRPIAWGRRIAAITLLPFLTFWVVAITEAPHTVLSVVVYLAAPAVAAVAIRRSAEGGPGFPLRYVWPAVTILIIAAVTLDSAGGQRPGASLDLPSRHGGDPATLGLGLVGRLDLVGEDSVPSLGWSAGIDGIDFHVPRTPAQAARFPRLSAELWPATADLAAIDPRASGPLLAVELRPGVALRWREISLFGGRFLVLPREDRQWLRGRGRRTELLIGTMATNSRVDWGTGTGWIALVATGPDGTRQVLDWSAYRSRLGFQGTVLEWLLADRSPAPLRTD